MIFRPTDVAGAFVVDVESIEDERGFFARAWCRREFEAQGLRADLAQCDISWNAVRGTLRGMHYQEGDAAQAKLVRCTAGAVHDVILDVRPESKSYRCWFAIELSVRNRRALYVPEGVAHGFQTLEDASEIFYQMSAFYDPATERGVRWDDPTTGIRWPMQPVRISARDRALPLLDE